LWQFRRKSVPTPPILLPPDQEDDTILIELPASDWILDPGQSIVGQASITNQGDSRATFWVGIEGLDPDWFDVSPSQIDLNPHQQGLVSFRLSPPRLPSSQAGTYPCALVVTSSHQGGQRSQRAMSLTVQPYYEFYLGEPTPRRQTLKWFAPSGRVALPITNEGNCPARIRLEGVNEERACSFEFETPGQTVRLAGQAEVLVPPGETLLATAYITPLNRRLIGLGKRTHFCVLSATLLAEGSPRQGVLTRIQAAPLIGAGPIAFLAVCLAALMGLVLQRIVGTGPVDFPIIRSIRNERQLVSDAELHRSAQATAMAASQSAAGKNKLHEISYEDMFREIAGQHNLDWKLLAELAYRESHLDPLAVGAAREVGLMQILPSTWEEWAPIVGASDAFDPYSNIQVAAAYLSFLKEYCRQKGYVEDYWMLVAYNWGPDNTRRLFDEHGGWDQVPAETRRYTLGILRAAETGAMSPALLEGLEATVWVKADAQSTN
jgi:membrane-bound lytic murein transglycosylase F